MHKYIIKFQPKKVQIVFLFLISFVMIFSSHTSSAQQKDMMIRIAEIEIFPENLEEYKAILKVESAASVKLETGVVSIFPMFQKENPTLIKILEIYANREAYEAHLKTPHFLHYKTSTLKMVKSLKLIEMNALDLEALPAIFLKMK